MIAPMKYSSLCVLAILLAAFPSFGGLIYSNGQPDLQYGYGITAHRILDDFVVGESSSVAGVRFWGVGSIPFPAAFSGTITWAVHGDTAGAPGSVLASGTLNGLSGVPTGTSLVLGPPSVYPVYRVDFDLTSPLALTAGTYWLELHNGPTLISEPPDALSPWIYWVTSGPGNLWSGNVPDYGGPMHQGVAFELSDSSFTQVPEPNSMFLLAGGLAGMFLRGRRTSGRTTGS